MMMRKHQGIKWKSSGSRLEERDWRKQNLDLVSKVKIGILSPSVSQEERGNRFAVLRPFSTFFTSYGGSVVGFNKTSRVPYRAIPLSFYNTQICAPMVKYIYLKRSRQQWKHPLYSHSGTFHTLWWFCGGFQHYLQSPVYSHISEFW